MFCKINSVLFNFSYDWVLLINGLLCLIKAAAVLLLRLLSLTLLASPLASSSLSFSCNGEKRTGTDTIWTSVSLAVSFSTVSPGENIWSVTVLSVTVFFSFPSTNWGHVSPLLHALHRLPFHHRMNSTFFSLSCFCHRHVSYNTLPTFCALIFLSNNCAAFLTLRLFEIISDKTKSTGQRTFAHKTQQTGTNSHTT